VGGDALAAVQDLEVMRRDAQLDLRVYQRVRDAVVVLLVDDVVVDVDLGGPVAGELVAGRWQRPQGRPVERLDVIENGARFIIRPAEGLNPGLFLDMREVREFVRASAAGNTVLNCFAYTCAFGVAALQGGAARVLNLDISRHYLDWGRENVELNGYATVLTDFVKGDVFDWLKRFGRRGQKFDVVILDPPSYSTTHETRFAVEHDTARLVALAAPVVQPGGTLIACTNYEQLPQRGFVSRVREGLAGTAARIVETWHEPDLDFPVAPGAQPYLKVCVVKFE